MKEMFFRCGRGKRERGRGRGGCRVVGGVGEKDGKNGSKVGRPVH